MADGRADAGDAPATLALNRRRAWQLVVAYDGTGFRGWQIQPDALTVQGALLDAARRLFEGEVRVVGASRTDAGVHALGQAVALTAEGAFPPATVRAALNAHLPREIRVM